MGAYMIKKIACILLCAAAAVTGAASVSAEGEDGTLALMTPDKDLPSGSEIC